MKKCIMIIIITAFIAMTTGCSIDRIESLRHPEKAKPNETVSVVMTNIYTFLNNSRTVSLMGASRDSVHLLIRVPQGYEVVEAKSYIIPDFTISHLFDQLNGGGINDSLLQKYTDKLEPMVRNESLDTRFKGRTFNATSIQDRSTQIPVFTDDGNWIGYSAKVDININMGDQMDTIFSIDSVKSLAFSFGIDTSSLDISSLTKDYPFLKIDSIAVTATPILLQTTLRTSMQHGTDTLYYYSKTSSLPAPGTDPSINPDVGSMMFSELKIEDTPSPIISTHIKSISSNFRAFPNPFSTSINLYTPLIRDGLSFSIYSVEGTLIKTIDASHSGSAIWNGRDASGKLVQSGRYIVRLNTDMTSVSQVINLIR